MLPELERLRSEGRVTLAEGLAEAGVRTLHGGEGTPTVVQCACHGSTAIKRLGGNYQAARCWLGKTKAPDYPSYGGA